MTIPLNWIKKGFIILLLIWTVINSTAPIKTNPFLQYVAILFAIMCFIVICVDVCLNRILCTMEWNLLDKLLVLYLFFSLISILTSTVTFGFKGLLQSGYVFCSLVINYLLFKCRLTEEDFYLTLKIGLYTSSILVVASLLLSFTHENIQFLNESGKIFEIGYLRSEHRLAGLSGNPNDMARLCLFNLFCGLISFSNSRNNVFKVFAFLACTASIISIALTGSRAVMYSVMLVTFCFIIIMSFYLTNYVGLKYVLKRLVIPELVILFLMLSTNIRQMPHKFSLYEANISTITTEDLKASPKIKESSQQVNQMSSGRLDLILTSLSATLKYSPFLGLTPGYAKEQTLSYIKENNMHISSSAIGNAHNVLIQSYIFFGIAPFIFMMIIYVIFTKYTLSFIRFECRHGKC